MCSPTNKSHPYAYSRDNALAVVAGLLRAGPWNLLSSLQPSASSLQLLSSSFQFLSSIFHHLSSILQHLAPLIAALAGLGIALGFAAQLASKLIPASGRIPARRDPGGEGPGGDDPPEVPARNRSRNRVPRTPWRRIVPLALLLLSGPARYPTPDFTHALITRSSSQAMRELETARVRTETWRPEESRAPPTP